ncbi:Phosphoenolpyruvate carboxykinase 1 [Hibiscus syriacus]|uniref:Phosphoenolpyruvate carboxykinase 1 n=1 Tax=Hibiscus syriacus TaxID=106335 RepID=A0A6A2XEU5_HIBSY|nr:Phosphoenolpyruvate carboxykinase 1 [Hibiscus syriacus]
MEHEDDMKLKGDTKEKMFQIYTEFLTGVAKLDELVAVGGRLLTGFQQGLEFLRRPAINKASKLIENIIKANETNRLKSYLEAGCINNHDRVHNTSKFESLLNDLECFLRDATAALQMANQQLSPLLYAESSVGLHPHESDGEDEMVSSCLLEPEVTDYAVLMGIVYSMVKQDCTMQGKIVKSLNLKTTSEELESYSLMWTLRPYINNQTMQLAWKIVP